MSVVYVNESNLKAVVDLSLLLFPEETFSELFKIYQECLTSEKERVFLYQKDNQYVGYLHLAIRSDYVNGTNTSPVVFVEAIYVLPKYQRHGIGREFIKFAESFAKTRNIKQIASDCFIDNVQSVKFHKNCGFIEKERVICFVKDIK